jgi:DNA polymerase III subunit epsilon
MAHPYIIPDVETTGRRTYNSKIVEVGAIVLDAKFEELERWSTLVDPGPEALALAQPKAMEVNKLTAADLQGAPTTADAAKRFQALLDRYPDATLHAFNNEFDSWFLAKDPWNVKAGRWGECIMLAAMDIMDPEDALPRRSDGSVKFPNLREAAEFFRVKSKPSHRTIDDCRTAADVFIEILRRRRSCPNETALQQEARYMMGEGL